MSAKRVTCVHMSFGVKLPLVMFSKDLNMQCRKKIRGGCQLIVALREDERRRYVILARLQRSRVGGRYAVYFLGVKLRPAPAQNKVTPLYNILCC